MLIYVRNVQRKKLIFGAENIAFPYFYITAFCSLTDRLKFTWRKGDLSASNRERPEKFRISENNKVIYFSLKFPWLLNWFKSPFREIKFHIVPESFHLLFSLHNLIDWFRNYTARPTNYISRIKKYYLIVFHIYTI